MQNPSELFITENPPEATETIRERAAEEIKAAGYRFQAQEHDAEGRDPKTYHTSEHLLALDQRAKHMADALRLLPKQRVVIEMAIAWHDTVIEYDKADPDNLLSLIHRHRGARESDKPKGPQGNEAKSARLLEQEMRKANRLGHKEEIFTEEQIRTASRAIEATYPDVNLGPDFKGATFSKFPYYEAAISQNPDLGSLFDELETQGITKGPLFFQPHLEKPLEDGQKVPREILVVALCDLGAAGSAEKEAFFKEGDDEMRELYANLRQPGVMRRLATGDGETDRMTREKVAATFIGWIDGQPGFAAWQALRFEKILYLLKRQNGVTSEEEQALRLQFGRFTDNIRAARDRADKLKTGFEETKSTRGDRAAFVYLAQNLHCQT